MGRHQPDAARVHGERFIALDGLRTFAMACVVWHHSARNSEGFFDRAVGVTLFFAISGFLITTLLLREKDRTGGISIGNFYLRRALRISPLYFAVLFFYVILVAAAERHTVAGAEFWSHLPFFLTFTANWLVNEDVARNRVIFYFAWSLSMQEQFYLLWPWVVRFWSARRTVTVAVLGALVAMELRWLPLTTADAIWMGCVVGYLRHQDAGANVLRRVAGGWWSAPVALAVILVPVILPRTPISITRLGLVYLVAVCVTRPGVLAPLLENRVARYIGSVTYGIYLLHMLVINCVRHVAPSLSHAALFAVVFSLCIVAASVTAHYFERPLMSRGLQAAARAKLKPIAPGAIPLVGLRFGRLSR